MRSSATSSIIEGGGRITQETRLYNAHEGKTYGMRSKEQAHDYRYFPEPDLLPLVVDEKWQAAIRASLPELPEARRQRMMKEYGITAGDAHTLTLTRAHGRSVRVGGPHGEKSEAGSQPRAERITRTAESAGPRTRAVANFDGRRYRLGRSGRVGRDLRQNAERSLRSLLRTQTRFPCRLRSRGAPEQSRDTSALEKLADELIAANPKQVEQYRAGKKTMIGFFVGQLMKASKGQANPQLVNEVLTKKLEA